MVELITFEVVESHASTAWDAIKRHGWLAMNLGGMGGDQAKFRSMVLTVERLDWAQREGVIVENLFCAAVSARSIVGPFQRIGIVGIIYARAMDQVNETWHVILFLFTLLETFIYSSFQTREISVYADEGFTSLFSRINIYGIFILYLCDKK